MSKLESTCRDSGNIDGFDTNSKRVRRLEVDRKHQQEGATPTRRPLGSFIPGGSAQSAISNVIITPCAACKLLRRRCAQECPFSPYFPPHEPQKFASVHKVFGASNVSKMLFEVPENQRADTANSLIYEANARIRDPVYGCMGTISALQQQAQSLQAELAAVRTEIMRYQRHESAVAAEAAAPASAYASGVIVSGFPISTQERALSFGFVAAEPAQGNGSVGPTRVTKDRYCRPPQ